MKIVVCGGLGSPEEREQSLDRPLMKAFRDLVEIGER